MNNSNKISLLQSKSSIYFVYTFLFFLLSLIGIFHHELWLDESHHWLLARDSTSISDLITNTKYEGHPILWNILLYSISRFSVNPFWMQLLHIIISTTIVFVFLKKAPFSLLFKTLFIFGYFIFYEYNLISRNYGIGILFLFLACNLYKNRNEKFVLFSLFLMIANNTHAIFIVLSSCMILTTLLDSVQKNKFRLNSKIIVGLSIFFLGTLLALIQIMPPNDTSFFQRAENLTFLQKISKSSISFFKGVFAIPDFRTIHFWNSHLIVNLHKPFAAFLGILTFLIPIFIFYKNKITLLYVYLSILGTILFFFVTQLSAPRYFGMNFLIIITALWIEHHQPFTKNILNPFISLLFLQKIRTGIIYGILGVQLFSGITAYSMDLILPFSGAKQTISYLKDLSLENKIIVTKWCGGTSLSSYLERPIFFTNSNKYQSYCLWNRQDLAISNSEKEIVTSLSNILKNENQSIIFIALDTLPIKNFKNINNSLEYKFLKSFPKNVVTKESYYIYEVSKT